MTIAWTVIDFETASSVDLKKAGSWRYAEDVTTEVLCLAYSRPGQEPGLWIPGDDPAALLALVNDPNTWFIAHNTGFEKAIWRRIMVEQFGFPDIPNSRWHDTQAVCAMRVIPQDLEHAIKVLRLPHAKDTAASKFTIALSKADKRGYFDRSPEALKIVSDYCVQDIRGEVELHARLGWLPSGERTVWLLNQRINERGVRLDLDYIRAAQRIVDQASAPLLDEFKQLTGIAKIGSPKLVEWCNARGANLANMQKETLKEALDGGVIDDDEETNADLDETPEAKTVDDLPPDVRRALSIRQLIGSSSIKKLARMEQCVCADGRARGLLQYHGTGPGRSAGRLLQPQNFPRGTLEIDGEAPDPQIVVDTIMTGDPGYVEMVLGPPVEAVVSGLRHALVANRDRVFVSGDYSGIQARVVLAVAGQHDKVRLMDDPNVDIYCDMAQQIYKNPDITKANKKKYPVERQTGKNCFGPETLVLTRRGRIRIVDVRTDDQLWDGLEWVGHQGLVSRGQKATVLLNGIWATPEHPVLCGGQWHPWERLVHDASVRSRALDRGSANLPLLDMSTASAVGRKPWLRAALAAAIRTQFTWGTCSLAAQPAALGVLKKKQVTGARNFSATLTSCLRRLIAFGSSIVSPRVSTVATTRTTETFGTTAVGGYSFTSHGEKTAENSFGIWSRSVDGNKQSWNWTGRTWTKAISRAICALSAGEQTVETKDRWEHCNNGSWRWKPCYDLANAGPRHRFTIITDAGPMIVHNSVLGLGFQMGASKFHLKYGKYKQGGVLRQHKFEFCQTVVIIYRKEWAPEVPKLWYGLEDAAVTAVWDKRPCEAYGVEYRLEDNCLRPDCRAGARCGTSIRSRCAGRCHTIRP